MSTCRSPSVASELLVAGGLVLAGAGAGAALWLAQNYDTQRSNFLTAQSDSTMMWRGALFGALLVVVVLLVMRLYLHSQGCRFGAAGWAEPSPCAKVQVTREATTVTPLQPVPVTYVAPAIAAASVPDAEVVAASSSPIVYASPPGPAYASYYALPPSQAATPRGTPPISVSLFRI
jgi:hypothetical protein